LRRLHAEFSRPQHLFLASVSTEDLAIAALHAGARGYLREPWIGGESTSLHPPLHVPGQSP
jgi:hypothetical protein